jgi:hypothetical protein
VLRPVRECRQSGQAVEEMEGEELNDEKLAPQVIVGVVDGTESVEADVC